jgi:hypothetical protein
MSEMGRSRIALLVSVALLSACGKSDKNGDTAMATPAGAASAADPQAAEYTVVFKSRWTKSTHPVEYPEQGVVTGAHFSGIIGASHSSSYSIFGEGTMPTPGLEKLSEEGKHTPLDEEIRAAIAAGNAGSLFESGPLKDFGDSLVTTVKVDAAHPMVSLVAMIAPSPDWFTGASNIQLMENGRWVDSRTVELNAWDSGGDDGATYKAADKDNNPKKPTMINHSRHFMNASGQMVPVATITLMKK